MKKNGILTLLFAFIPGAGQMYQGYMKRGLSLVLMAAAISMAAMLIPPIAFALLVVFMYSFFDTFNLRAQISMGTAPEDDYLVHFDPQDKRLARMMMDSHKLVGWCLIAIGALIAYEQIIMNTLGDILWRWGQKAPVWRAIYLVMDQLPEVVLCVALILCGIWLVRGPRAKKAAPEAAPEETDFQEYQPEKKMPSLLDRIARKAEPDTTGEGGHLDTGSLPDCLRRAVPLLFLCAAFQLGACAEDRPGGRADPAGVRGAVFCRKASALEVRFPLGAPLHRADGQRLWRGLPDGSL